MTKNETIVLMTLMICLTVITLVFTIAAMTPRIGCVFSGGSAITGDGGQSLISCERDPEEPSDFPNEWPNE